MTKNQVTSFWRPEKKVVRSSGQKNGSCLCYITSVDPKKETKYLDRHEELAGQFDYTHLQINDPGGPVTRHKPNPVDAKLFHPKYILTITVITVVNLITISFLSTLLSYFIFVIVLIFLYRTVSRLKEKGKDDLTQWDKFKMVAFMTFEPLVGQAIYYYRLKKTMPRSASIALKIGWQVLVLFVAGVIIYIYVSVTQSWQYRYGDLFQSNLNGITRDLNEITKDAKEYDGPSLMANCKKLSQDIAWSKKLPSYPNENVQTEITEAMNKLDMGAKDCVESLTYEKPELLKKSSAELNEGYADLRKAVELMKR